MTLLKSEIIQAHVGSSDLGAAAGLFSFHCSYVVYISALKSTRRRQVKQPAVTIGEKAPSTIHAVNVVILYNSSIHLLYC